MTEGGVKYPQVFTVDSYMNNPPPLPPRPAKRRQIGPTQVLLFLLVSVALCGMVIEAWLIYRLYHPGPTATPVETPSAAKMIGDVPVPNPTPTKWPRLNEAPSKPLAHVTDGYSVVHGKEIMSWNENGDPLLYKVNYKDGQLKFQKKGYYYIYSKVSFHNYDFFDHSIQVKTKTYSGNSITLLRAKHKNSHESQTSNSFLAGIFYFYKHDAIFVKVSDTSKVVHHEPTENVFGAFMI